MTTNKFRDKMIDKNLKHLMLKMLPVVIFKWGKNEMKITLSPFPVNIMFFLQDRANRRITIYKRSAFNLTYSRAFELMKLTYSGNFITQNFSLLEIE